ncbi:OmpA family protein [Intestinirhabdus alba]|jgi:outer membrane protein OmpA-like peptidoglycan-associated protein|uniref:OmpA family protein n=1 Tax=Intestinirhabdus alba TaxID=2899544 RepID=A0A6L6IIM2_9ENTR|nr:OmpA family protein [Intestinirhabdus alba]MTH46691.1 OmpA family protein [Intestinirhabdus alba]
MVKSENYLCRLVGIDTLLSFDGVVPCVEDFQLKLVTLIEQLHKALLAENEAPAASEALCRALCCYFDRRLIEGGNLSWQRYSLVHYFYGHTEDEGDMVAQLEALLRDDSDTLFRYAWKLLILFIQLAGQTPPLVALRATHRSRYLSRPRPPQMHSQKLPAVGSSPDGSPRLMIFILGPFAGKWFRQSDLSSSHSSGIVWAVVEHAASLAKRLEYLHKNYPGMSTLGFFPLLVDGMESSGVLIEQLTAWQYALSATQLPERLPCLLGLYSRLSQERASHDPDRAIWTGGLLTTSHASLPLEAQLVGLTDALDAAEVDADSDLYAIQRHALGSTLLAWLAENRIVNVLEALFAHGQLSLAGVMLADHGSGFTRHGAWSIWLAEKYGILPGLSAAIAMPALPAITLPPEPETPPAPHREAPLPASVRWRWPAVIALLALCLALAAALWHTGFWNTPDEGAPAAAFDRQAGLSPSLFTLSEATPFFAKGSAALLPESEKALRALLPEIESRPQQMFLIVGHADSSGSAAVNMTLSIERARAIRDWLVQHTGVPASRFLIEGAGNSRPIASNETREGRALNRRVEIVPLSTQVNQN